MGAMPIADAAPATDFADNRRVKLSSGPALDHICRDNANDRNFGALLSLRPTAQCRLRLQFVLSAV
jgi:hypothetical protein